MASLSTRRIGSSLTWSLQWATRSRSIQLSFMSSERRRHHYSSHRSHPRSHFQPPIRQFSSHTSHQQDTAVPSATIPISKPPTYRTTASSPRPTSSREQPPTTARQFEASPPSEPIRELSHGLSDGPIAPTSLNTSESSNESDVPLDQVDWARSFHGLSTSPFPKEAADALLQPILSDDIEIKPDGIIYLPEIKYRRILNKAFGPGGWGLAPRGETIVTAKAVTREYALLAHGRLVSIARGEQDYFDSDGIPTATEGCKSNAMMRCCKDLGVASELWDPRFIRRFTTENAKEVWVEHSTTKKRKKIYVRKDDQVRYPWKETKMTSPV